MLPRRVLAMDGGGILSLLTLTLLRRIEEESPGFLESVDVLAGTSAGGINALLLASREDPLEGLDLCLELWGGDVPIYDAPKLREALAVAGKLAFTSDMVMKGYLEDCLGDMRLGDLHRRVLVPAFDLRAREGRASWGPRIFCNFGPGSDRDGSLRAVDVGIATSAFPVSFPVHGGYIDGGIYANNPAMCALAHVLHTARHAGGTPDHREEVAVLAVGTGSQPQSIEVENADWGWGRWLMDGRHPIALVDAVLDSVQEVVDYQCGEILGHHRYFRLNPPLEQTFSVAEERGHQHGGGLLGTVREHSVEVAEATDLGPVVEWLEKGHWAETLGMGGGDDAGGSGGAKKSGGKKSGGKKPAKKSGGKKSGGGKGGTKEPGEE